MSAEYKQLQALLNDLSDVDRMAVIAFAEYLHHRQQSTELNCEVRTLSPMARPVDERVPAALRRLRLMYPMLDASDLLAEASDLLSQHLMLGRSASVVIDDMELLFLRHYELYQLDVGRR